MLGVESPFAPWMVLLTVTLIIYQVFRWFLTNWVVAMRDAEERSWTTPACGDTRRRVEGQTGAGLVQLTLGYRHDYGFLYRLHQVVQTLGFLAIATFALRAIEVLFMGDVLLFEIRQSMKLLTQ